MSRTIIANIADLGALFMYDEERAVTWQQFFANALELARAFPPGSHVVNLCEGRYGFTAGLVAALLAKRVTVLPGAAAGLEACIEDTPASFVLVDPGKRFPCAMPVLEVSMPRIPPPADGVEVPSIDSEQVACVVFSSGSTGASTAHVKYWGELAQTGREIGERFGFAIGRQAVVGTVPSRHMFGLETTVLLPLQWGCTVYAGRPLLPADIDIATRRLEGERWLMTTPIQLRALADDALCQARFEAVISATMPLSAGLASQVEVRYGAAVHEIFGCTEAGSLATRRTTESARWEALTGITVEERAGRAWVHGGHVRQSTPLADIVSIADPAHFDLLGRAAHLVKVGGKRTSLEALNSTLTQIPGVEDGCFFVPEEPGDGGTRLVAFAVAPGVAAARLIAELRERLDSVFIPRPLYVVQRLPRNDLGKLTRRDLAEMAERLSGADDAVPG
jgi:acyl-coenzyme A synthetase/AMP-(fatty) acid ligase